MTKMRNKCFRKCTLERLGALDGVYLVVINDGSKGNGLAARPCGTCSLPVEFL